MDKPFTAVLLGLPTWLVVLLCITLAVGVSVIGLVLVRRLVSASLMKLHNDVAGFIFATLGVIYAVVLAFVVLVVWEELNNAQENTSNETAVALTINRTIDVVPDAEQARDLKRAFRKYVELVVTCEFPAQRRFEDCTESRKALVSFWHAVAGLDPNSMEEQNIQAALLAQLGEMQKLRRLRQEAVTDHVPTPIWGGIIIGAFLTIGFTFLFGAENRWAQTLMTACLGAMIGLVISIILIMDHPFMGDVAVQPDGFEHILSVDGAEPNPQQ
jgi:hypothetical protein